jgi:L-gulonate 5-dehydrogenase
MRQVVLERPGSLVLRDTEPGRPGPGQALVRLRWAGICGSDLAAYRGTSPLVSYPRVLGHELLVDVLEAAGRPELVGQRAVVEPLLPCGTCRACRHGRPNCCVSLRVLGVHVDGGMAETALIAEGALHAVPDGMPDGLAALAEPTTIAYHAVQRAGIDAGGVAVVLGAGTIGLLVAQLLRRARGCRTLVHDPDAWRLQQAERLGAVAVEGDAAAVRAAVWRASGGEGADVVFEASGSEASTRLTTDLVAAAGRIVLIGWNHGPVPVDTVTLMRKEVDLLGSRNSVAAFPPVLRLLADGVVDADVLVTHRFSLSRAADALALLDRGGPALKILIGPGDPPP